MPDATYLREFPAKYRASQSIKFHPSQPERLAGDVLEIGPGRGDFLLTEATAHPDKRFVAIELGKKRYAKLVRRIDGRGLANVTLIFGDARVVVPKYIGPETFQSVVVLFPDPWPKRRHAFNRLLQPEFLAELSRVLCPGGHLHIKSDVESYIDWVKGQVSRMSQFRVVDDCWPWGSVDGIDGKSLSLFADRQTGFGYGIHSLCLLRTSE